MTPDNGAHPYDGYGGLPVKDLDDIDTDARIAERFRSGWWILPAVALGALIWGAITWGIA